MRCWPVLAGGLGQQFELHGAQQHLRQLLADVEGLVGQQPAAGRVVQAQVPQRPLEGVLLDLLAAVAAHQLGQRQVTRMTVWKGKRSAISARTEQPSKLVRRAFVKSCSTFSGRESNLPIGAPVGWFFTTGISAGTPRGALFSPSQQLLIMESRGNSYAY